MIDSRGFLAARKRATREALLPAGPKVAVTGGLDFNDHRLIWASHRKVTQIAFRPDWTKHAKAAPFKRNDAMLETLPIGVLHFSGTGIQDNLADKARKLGIPVWSVRGS